MARASTVIHMYTLSRSFQTFYERLLVASLTILFISSFWSLTFQSTVTSVHAWSDWGRRGGAFGFAGSAFVTPAHHQTPQVRRGYEPEECQLLDWRSEAKAGGYVWGANLAIGFAKDSFLVRRLIERYDNLDMYLTSPISLDQPIRDLKILKEQARQRKQATALRQPYYPSEDRSILDGRGSQGRNKGKTGLSNEISNSHQDGASRKDSVPVRGSSIVHDDAILQVPLATKTADIAGDSFMISVLLTRAKISGLKHLQIAPVKAPGPHTLSLGGGFDGDLFLDLDIVFSYRLVKKKIFNGVFSFCPTWQFWATSCPLRTIKLSSKIMLSKPMVRAELTIEMIKCTGNYFQKTWCQIVNGVSFLKKLMISRNPPRALFQRIRHAEMSHMDIDFGTIHEVSLNIVDGGLSNKFVEFGLNALRKMINKQGLIFKLIKRAAEEGAMEAANLNLELFEPYMYNGVCSKEIG